MEYKLRLLSIIVIIILIAIICLAIYVKTSLTEHYERIKLLEYENINLLKRVVLLENPPKTQRPVLRDANGWTFVNGDNVNLDELKRKYRNYGVIFYENFEK